MTKKAKSAQQDGQSLASIIQSIESLVEQLEQNDGDLHEAMGHFEDGIKLARRAQQILEQAEQRVKMLTTDANEQTYEESSAEGQVE